MIYFSADFMQIVSIIRKLVPVEEQKTSFFSPEDSAFPYIMMG